MHFYVYQYSDENDIPFYVGKGKKKRFSLHLSRAKKPRKGKTESSVIRKCRELLNRGIEPKIEIIADGLSENQAFDLEIKLIEYYGRQTCGGILVNLTVGGEGTSGLKQTAEHVEKRVSQFRGKRMSDIARKNMMGARGPASNERKKKIKERANSVEARARVSKQFKNKALNSVHKEKISKSMKKLGIKPPRMIGKNNPSSKSGTVKMPNGNILEFECLTTFCKQNNLNVSTVRNTLNQNRPLKRGLFAGLHLLTLI